MTDCVSISCPVFSLYSSELRWTARSYNCRSRTSMKPGPAIEEWSFQISQFYVWSQVFKWLRSVSSDIPFFIQLTEVFFHLMGMSSYSWLLLVLISWWCCFRLMFGISCNGYFLADMFRTFFSILPSDVRTRFVNLFSNTGTPRLNEPFAIISLILFLSFRLLLCPVPICAHQVVSLGYDGYRFFL